MTKWHLVKDNTIIDSIESETREFVESNFADFDILEDDGVIGIGWKNNSGIWKPDYPVDGKEYVWDEEGRFWSLVYSPDEDPII